MEVDKPLFGIQIMLFPGASGQDVHFRDCWTEGNKRGSSYLAA